MGLSNATKQLMFRNDLIGNLKNDANSKMEEYHYNELLNELRKQLPPTAIGDSLKNICKILAKDPNSKIDDVMAMHNKANSYGYSDSADFVQNFQNALKRIPNYENTKLNAKNLNDLMDIFHQCGGGYGGAIGSAKSYMMFEQRAEEYIKNLNKPTTSRDTINNIKDDFINNIEDNTVETGTPNISNGAEMMGKLNQIDLNIKNAYNTFN